MSSLFTIREAKPGDEALIRDQLLALASYEELEDQVLATLESIRIDYFEKQRVHALFVEKDNQVVAFTTWYPTYATFNGISGLFIEDLFVNPKFRKQGIGTAIFAYLEDWGKRENCAYIEWFVLDWNTEAQTFYKKSGGKPLSQWQVYRKDIE